jgi:hypothetical protein
LGPEPRTDCDVETRFGTVHVHRYGPAAGEPIVLLHGHGANASTWYPQVAALGAEPSSRSVPSRKARQLSRSLHSGGERDSELLLPRIVTVERAR